MKTRLKILSFILASIIWFGFLYVYIFPKFFSGKIFAPAILIDNLEIAEVKFCKDFPKISGQISCQQALKIALTESPGRVFSVQKDEVRKIWKISIRLKTPRVLPNGEKRENIGIFIDFISGKIIGKIL